MTDDLPLLAAAGGRVGVTTCPKGYLKHNWDVTPLVGLNDVGVPVALGTDGCGSNNTLDVVESMRFTQLVHMAHGGWEWATAERVLHHATVQSAAVAWLDAGAIEPGRVGDLVLVDLDRPHLQPVHDLATTLTMSLLASDVVTTVVAGRVLMHERRLRTIDVEDVMARAASRAPALADVSHGRRIQTYAP